MLVSYQDTAMVGMINRGLPWTVLAYQRLSQFGAASKSLGESAWLSKAPRVVSVQILRRGHVIHPWKFFDESVTLISFSLRGRFEVGDLTHERLQRLRHCLQLQLADKSLPLSIFALIHCEVSGERHGRRHRLGVQVFKGAAARGVLKARIYGNNLSAFRIVLSSRSTRTASSAGAYGPESRNVGTPSRSAHRPGLTLPRPKRNSAGGLNTKRMIPGFQSLRLLRSVTAPAASSGLSSDARAVGRFTICEPVAGSHESGVFAAIRCAGQKLKPGNTCPQSLAKPTLEVMALSDRNRRRVDAHQQNSTG